MALAFRNDTAVPSSQRGILLDPARIGVYGFVLAVAYLAGVYLGGVLLVIWYAVLLLPVVSVCQALITRRSLYVREETPGNDPVKGQILQYSLTVTNESVFPSSPVVLSLHRGLARSGRETRSLYLWMRETRRVNQTVPCLYRGTYTVGLASLVVWDVFGLIGFTRRVSARTFTIYPRILEIPTAPSGTGPYGALADSPVAYGKTDTTLLRELRVYRPGDDVRHVSWRKFALLGEPLIREYDQAAEGAITICADTRAVEGEPDRAMHLEDCVLEIVIALARYYLTQEVPVTIVTGVDVLRLDPGDPPGFSRFHVSTATMVFESKLPPAMIYDYQRSDPSFVDGAVVFVSHSVDPGVLDFIERSGGAKRSAAITATFNGEATPHMGGGSAFNGHDEPLLKVASADALVEEFRKWQADGYQ